MYVPPKFAVEDRDKQLQVIRDQGWGCVVSVEGAAPVATHLPFVVEGDAGKERLAFHLAHENPQWKTFAERRQILVVFQGPHSYVTPSWCEARRALPTWAYAAIHVYGRPQIVDDPDKKRRMQQRLVAYFEARFENQWTMDHLDEKWVDTMLKRVVSFELPIERMESIFRLLQNRPENDRVRVADRLAQSPDSNARSIAEMISRHAS